MKQGQNITYTFTPVGALEKIEGKMTTQDQIMEGNAVTVLYDPKRPRLNVIYEYCDFEAAS